MAERIPPIEIKVTSDFEKKGITEAIKKLGQFERVATKAVDGSDKKVRMLKNIYSDLSSGLNKDNKKIAASMKKVETAFDNVEKKKEKIVEKETKLQSAIANTSKAALRSQNSISNAFAFDEKYIGVKKNGITQSRIKNGVVQTRDKNTAAFVDNISLTEKRNVKIRNMEAASISLAEAQDKEKDAVIAVEKARNEYNKSIERAATLTKALVDEVARENNINRISAQQVAEKKAEKERIAAEKERVAAEKEAEKQRVAAEKERAKAEKERIKAEEKAAKESENIKKAEIKKAEEKEKAITRIQIAQAEAAEKQHAKISSSLQKSLKGTLGVFKKIRKAIKKINFTQIIAKFYAIGRVASFLNSFVESSSEWIENLNLLEVVYNDTATAADEVKEKISNLSEAFRMDINALAQYISVFKQMANAMGQTAEVGSQMAEVLSLIALDVSSLRNVDVQTVVSDFTGALAGQVKPVRKYGFDITMYSIDELMKELGYGAISRSMTQANKQLARAILLVRQSKDAWGDLAKTINTYANQQRVLNDQFTQFKRLLGNVLLGTFEVGDSFDEASKTAGIMQKGIWYLNGAMIAVNTVLDAIIPKVTNFNGSIATGAEEVTDALKEEDEALNSTLAGFDKFNSLEEGSGFAGNISKDLEALLGQETQSYMEQFQERLKNINMYAEDIAETILGILFPEYSSWKGGDESKTFKDWAEQSGNFSEKLVNIKDSLIAIGKTVAWLASPIIGMFTTLSEQMLEASSEEREKYLEKLIITANGVQNALTSLSKAFISMVDAFLPLITFFSDFIALIASSPSAIWAMVAAIAALAVTIQAVKIASTFGVKGWDLVQIIGIGGAITAGLALTSVAISDAASRHAQGGFQTGGLFYAGEAGPEWVGRQGSTSTIINDGQMSDIMRDSVAKGVMQANIASRQISGAGRSGKVAVVNLNGKHLFDVVEQEGYKEGKVFAKSR